MHLRTLKICLKTHEIDPQKSFSPPRLAWQAVLRKAKVKSDLLTYINMLLMVEKLIQFYATLFIDIQKLIINT